MDLKTKLAFALVAASLLSMAIFAYLTHISAEDLFFEDSRRQLDAFALSRKNEIEGVITLWTEETQGLVARIQASQLTRDEIESRKVLHVDQLTRMLRRARASSESMRRVTLYDVEGNALLDGGQLSLDSFDSLADGEVVFSRVGEEPDGRTSLVLRTPLFLAGQRAGLVEVAFDTHPLAPFIGRTPGLGETAETGLVLPDGPSSGDAELKGDAYLLVTSLRDGAAAKGAASPLAEAPIAIAAALRGEEEVFTGIADRRGEEVIAATRFLAEPGWGLVVKIDSAEARDRADRLLTHMRDIGVALGAFATLAGVLLGLKLGRPIHELRQVVERIRHGELGLRLKVDGEDEVAFLAQSLNEFMDQLDRSSDLFRVGGLRVLVAASDAGERKLFGDLLKSWNMRPTLAESAEAARAAIEEASEAELPIQIVLLDETIHDTDGNAPSIGSESRSAPQVPVILLTSKPDRRGSTPHPDTTITRTLPKPVVASHLMEAILDEMGVSPESLVPTTDAYVKKTEPRAILLAEDNRLMQQVMIGFLENWGHDVTLAENGRIAFEAIQQRRFDLILMDVMMPEMNGLDATAAIRAHERERSTRTPIVALTAEAFRDDRERCLAAGMDDYISKPVDPKALYALIERFPTGGCAVASQKTTPTSRPSPPSHEIGDDEPVDWVLARSLTGNDEALLSELIEAFPGESREQVEAMRRGIDQAEMQLLSRSAHSLKSAALIFGASALAEAALSMEKLERPEDLPEARILLERLEVELRRINEALASHRAGEAGGD